MNYQKEIDAAVQWAEKAGRRQMELRESLKVEIKGDASPVTQADKESEEILRSGITELFPEDGILGEEEGGEVQRSGRLWILDPIDGTRPFIRGIDTHSVLIGWVVDGKPAAGVMHFPAKGLTYTGVVGEGAWLNGKPIKVSSIDALSRATGTQHEWSLYKKRPHWEKLMEIGVASSYIYGFMDAYSYGLIAEGRLDFSINLMDKPWDSAAGAAIISGAGGQWRDLEGGQDIFKNGVVFAANDKLMAEVFQILSN